MQCCCVVAVGDRSVEPTQHPCLCLLPEHFSGRLCWGVVTNNSQVGPNPLVLIWPMALLSGSYRVAVVQSMWVGFVKIVSHEKKVKPATGLLANSRLQGQGPQEMRLLGLEFFTLCSHPIRTRGTRACEVAWVSLLPSPCFPALHFSVICRLHARTLKDIMLIFSYRTQPWVLWPTPDGAMHLDWAL